ncbi:MAG: hypothetical protein WCT85_03940 [Parachlamydiales bacterium]|jgi:hypothetical protein
MSLLCEDIISLSKNLLSQDLIGKVQIYEYVQNATGDFSTFPEEAALAIKIIKENGLIAQNQLRAVSSDDFYDTSVNFISLARPVDRKSPIDHEKCTKEAEQVLKQSMEKIAGLAIKSQPSSSTGPLESQRFNSPVDNLTDDADFDLAVALSLEDSKPCSKEICFYSNPDSDNYNGNYTEEEAFRLAIEESLMSYEKTDSSSSSNSNSPKGKEKFKLS